MEGWVFKLLPPSEDGEYPEEEEEEEELGEEPDPFGCGCCSFESAGLSLPSSPFRASQDSGLCGVNLLEPVGELLSSIELISWFSDAHQLGYT